MGIEKEDMRTMDKSCNDAQTLLRLLSGHVGLGVLEETI
jgi:hypothetical protein